MYSQALWLQSYKFGESQIGHDDYSEDWEMGGGRRLKMLRARLTPINYRLHEGPKCYSSLSLCASKASGTQQVLSKYLLED